MSNDVYIIGIDMIKFGRFPNKTVPELAAESILLALDDANLSMADMQAFFCGNIKEVNRMVGQKTLQLVGQTGIPIVNCTNACATGATAFREGWMSIKAGVMMMRRMSWTTVFWLPARTMPRFIASSLLRWKGWHPMKRVWPGRSI